MKPEWKFVYMTDMNYKLTPRVERMKATKQWVCIYAKQWVDPGVWQRFFKIIATSVCFTLCRIRRKMSRAKGNPSLQILEYSTPRPKSQTQIWIWNVVGAKFSRWHLGINYFWSQLGSSMGLEITGYYYGGFLFDLPCWGLLCFSFLGELHQFTKTTRFPTFPLTQSPTTYI